MTVDTIQEQFQALKEFCGSEKKELVEKLEEILDDVAKSGQYIFQWNFMKPLYAYKLEKVTSEFLEGNPPLLTDGNRDEEKIKELTEFQKMLLETFDNFTSAPFTLQRISELLQHPEKHYKSTPKFFRGLEKNILVVTTIEPVTPEQRSLLKRSRVEDSTDTDKTDEKPPNKKLFGSDNEKIVTKDISAVPGSTSPLVTEEDNEAESTSNEKNTETSTTIPEDGNLKVNESFRADQNQEAAKEPVIKSTESLNTDAEQKVKVPNNPGVEKNNTQNVNTAGDQLKQEDTVKEVSDVQEKEDEVSMEC